MSLTEEQFEKLCFWLQEIEAGKKELNDWELGFYEDQVKRVEQYKSDVRLSSKQWACLEKIYKVATGG